VLVNDTVCLVLTPLVIEVARRLHRRPLPYLLGVAMASNVGSVATITGNPQNMIIGSLSHLPYATFFAALAPVAAAGLVLTFALIVLMHPAEFLTRERLAAKPPPARPHRRLAWKAVLVSLGMVVLFFAGQPVAKVALVGGALLLLTRSLKAEKVYREIDWPLLLMFAGLFVVVAALERSVLTEREVAAIGALHLDRVPVLTLLTASLSTLVSNVPAVLVLRPFVEALGDPARAWLVTAMASTLAGNLILVGSVANLIVAERARGEGIEIGFWPYARVGVPLSLATLALGSWWLS